MLASADPGRRKVWRRAGSEGLVRDVRREIPRLTPSPSRGHIAPYARAPEGPSDVPARGPENGRRDGGPSLCPVMDPHRTLDVCVNAHEPEGELRVCNEVVAEGNRSLDRPGLNWVGPGVNIVRALRGVQDASQARDSTCELPGPIADVTEAPEFAQLWPGIGSLMSAVLTGLGTLVGARAA